MSWSAADVWVDAGVYHDAVELLSHIVELMVMDRLPYATPKTVISRANLA
jgi:hypothetical protein